MGTTGLMLVRPLLAQSGLSQMNVC